MIALLYLLDLMLKEYDTSGKDTDRMRSRPDQA